MSIGEQGLDSISAALSSLVLFISRSVSSFLEQRLMIEPKQGQENTKPLPNWNAGKIKQILDQAKHKTGAAKGGGKRKPFLVT